MSPVPLATCTEKMLLNIVPFRTAAGPAMAQLPKTLTPIDGVPAPGHELL